MKESAKWTTQYQFLNMLLTNLKAVAISFVFLAAAFYGFIGKPVFKEILSVIFIAVYFFLVYSRSSKFASKDVKEYTKTKPSILKGVLFGAAISCTFIIALIIYRVMWLTAGADGVIESIPAYIYSLVFWFYTIPYSGIMGLSHGHMMWYSVLLMIVVPIAATTLGYIAGLKQFSILDKVSGMIYEKPEE